MSPFSRRQVVKIGRQGLFYLNKVKQNTLPSGTAPLRRSYPKHGERTKVGSQCLRLARDDDRSGQKQETKRLEFGSNKGC